MSKEKKNKVEWLNHFVGFMSVVLGVLIAFWLNSWNETRKEKGSIDTALRNIRNEIEKNLDSIDSMLAKNRNQRNMLGEYLESIDDKMNIRVPEERWRAIVEKFNGEIDESGKGVRVRIELFQLSEVAWSTTHRTGVLSAIDFELAFVLESTYDLQEKVNGFDDTLIADMRSISSNRESFERLFRSLDIEVDLATQLKEREYPKALKAINEYLRE